jgi:AcrR family transcriptional regulator
MSTEAKRSRAEAAAETVGRLVGVAQRAFAEEGYAAVSLDALAARAGVTRGALHHHFGNKAGLFAAVLRGIDAEIGDELDRVWEAHPDPWTAFRACYHAYLDAVLAPTRRRIVFRDMPAVMGIEGVDLLMNSGFAQLVGDLRALTAAGRIAAADPEALAHLFNGAAMQLAFWAAEGDTDRVTRAHAALDAMFDGVTIGKGPA